MAEQAWPVVDDDRPFTLVSDLTLTGPEAEAFIGPELTALAYQSVGTLTPEDPDGPEGNHGLVTCAVCSMPGWLMSANERGFLIRHDGSPFPHRAPR